MPKELKEVLEQAGITQTDLNMKRQTSRRYYTILQESGLAHIQATEDLRGNAMAKNQKRGLDAW